MGDWRQSGGGGVKRRVHGVEYRGVRERDGERGEDKKIVTVIHLTQAVE